MTFKKFKEYIKYSFQYYFANGVRNDKNKSCQ